ncbi:MAG: hypothetical protein RIB93_18880 [Coleofasciculus sp. D1-CHI-01]
MSVCSCASARSHPVEEDNTITVRSCASARSHPVEEDNNTTIP